MNSSRMAVSSNRNVIGHTSARVTIRPRQLAYAGAVMCLFFSLAFLYLVQAGQVARQTRQMEDLESEVERLKQQNNGVLLEISQHQQAARIKQQARALGLTEPDQVEYVVVEVDETAPGAQNEGRLTLGAGTDEPVFPALASLDLAPGWQRLVRQFRNWLNVGGGSSGGP
jgi:cell division protein FtsL